MVSGNFRRNWMMLFTLVELYLPDFLMTSSVIHSPLSSFSIDCKRSLMRRHLALKPT